MGSIKCEISSFLKKNNKINNVLGEFYVEEELGQGGTSIVRRATLSSNITNNFTAEFAIKFFDENIIAKESTAYKRFKQAHINILLIQNSGYVLPQIHFDTLKITQEISIPYIILKKAEKTLKQYKTENEIDSASFEKIFYALMDAIEEAHKYGIIHRDIKPENIFLLDGKWVLGDFDIASFSDDDGVKLVKTKVGDRLANYLFSAPEQSEKIFDEITQSADWYAFGQILYWLIHTTTLRGQGIVSFREHYQSLFKYEQLVASLLQQDPKKRPQSKSEIIKFLTENDKAYQERIFRIKKEKSLRLFDDIIYKYMFDSGIGGSSFRQFSDVNSIHEIMSDLKEKQDSAVSSSKCNMRKMFMKVKGLRHEYFSRTPEVQGFSWSGV